MSMLFISMFIIPSMEMYAVPTSIKQNLELSGVSGPIDSKEIETHSPVQEELLNEMSDANVMKTSDISGISESLETIKMEQEQASSMSNFSYAALFSAGIFICIFIGFVCHVISMICATPETDFQSMKTDLQPMETDQSIIRKVKVVCSLLILPVSLLPKSIKLCPPVGTVPTKYEKIKNIKNFIFMNK